MSYRITGIAGTEPISSLKANLEEAARTASKMEDQGVEQVRIFDSSGAEVSHNEWQAAWWHWANRSGDSDRT